MRRSEKLRQIYRELRLAGVEAPASDLVQIASLILRAYSGDTDEVDDFGVPRDTRSLVHMPVDSAMEDGGWRVLEFELKQSRSIDDLDPERLHYIRRIARKVIGSPWHYQPPQD
jgi:hypothetical protein